MQRYHTRHDSAAVIRQAIRRAAPMPDEAMEQAVREILQAVQARGDEAVLEFTRRWDCPTLEHLEVSPKEWEAAEERVAASTRAAIQTAKERIERFHQLQRRTSWWMTDERGALIGQLVRPLQRVGLYVPGGRALYPSSVLMNAIPAKVAGVPEIILCVPPRRDGSLPDSVLVAAKAAGVDRVFKVGGAQAIAALAFGTQTIPAVEKIVGPGNLYVNLAKRLLWGQVGVDLWAGPSEVGLIADSSANPAWIAADLITQLEHGSESVGYLFSPEESLVEESLRAIEDQLAQRTRQAIIRKALEHSVAVVTVNLQEAFEWANEAAPEHLSLMIAQPLQWLSQVRNAGCILLGHFTPQSAGDYVAGPSHTLPTGRAARFESPVQVETFLKRSSFISLSPDAMQELAAAIQSLAQEEGCEAHAFAAELRVQSL